MAGERVLNTTHHGHRNMSSKGLLPVTALQAQQELLAKRKTGDAIKVRAYVVSSVG